MIEYLKTYREDMPQWLKDYKSVDFVPFTEFMAAVLGTIRAAILMARDYLNRHLAMPRCVYGYHEIGRSGIRPEFVILGHSTPLWEGYERVAGAMEVRGGMHGRWRSLHQLMI